jgi:hypothetical protein
MGDPPSYSAVQLIVNGSTVSGALLGTLTVVSMAVGGSGILAALITTYSESRLYPTELRA